MNELMRYRQLMILVVYLHIRSLIGYFLWGICCICLTITPSFLLIWWLRFLVLLVVHTWFQGSLQPHHDPHHTKSKVESWCMVALPWSDSHHNNRQWETTLTCLHMGHTNSTHSHIVMSFPLALCLICNIRFFCLPLCPILPSLCCCPNQPPFCMAYLLPSSLSSYFAENNVISSLSKSTSSIW